MFHSGSAAGRQPGQRRHRRRAWPRVPRLGQSRHSPHTAAQHTPGLIFQNNFIQGVEKGKIVFPNQLQPVLRLHIAVGYL